MGSCLALSSCFREAPAAMPPEGLLRRLISLGLSVFAFGAFCHFFLSYGVQAARWCLRLAYHLLAAEPLNSWGDMLQCTHLTMAVCPLTIQEFFLRCRCHCRCRCRCCCCCCCFLPFPRCFPVTRQAWAVCWSISSRRSFCLPRETEEDRARGQNEAGH